MTPEERTILARVVRGGDSYDDAELPPGHPSRLLRALRDKIPEVKADDTSTMSGVTSRIGRTATALPRSALDTMANWLQGTHDPYAVKVGPDTLAPLGLAGFGMGLAPRGAVGAMGGGKPTKAALDMSEAARMHRAREQGFDTVAYHGSVGSTSNLSPPDASSGISAFVPRERGDVSWFSDSPDLANAFTRSAGQPVEDGAAIYPVRLRTGGFKDIDWNGKPWEWASEKLIRDAMDEGYQGIAIRNVTEDRVPDIRHTQYGVFTDVDPRNIRSTQAAFDPAKRDSADLLATSPFASAPGLAANAIQNPTEDRAMTEEDRRRIMAQVVRGDVPDYGLGPMTERTQRGLPNPEARSYTPTPGENAGLMARELIGGTTGERVDPLVRALLDYGPMPARGYADQIGRAGTSVAEAAVDPSISSVANAGVQTGAALARPAAIAGSAALGYADALRKDLGIGVTSPAEAQQKRKAQPAPSSEVTDLPGLTPDEQTAYKAAVREARDTAWKPKIDRERIAATVKDFQKRSADRAEGDRRLKEESARRKQESEQGEYDRRVQMAEALRDKEAGRDRRFSDTEVGKFYDKTGGWTPAAAAFGAGMLYRAGTGPAHSFLHREVAPWAVGTGAAFTAASAPSFYNGFLTEPDNPQKRALEVYGRELPEGHPRKQEAIDAAAAMQKDNPVAEAGKAEFEPWPVMRRAGVSALEGLGGPLGAYLWNTPRQIIRNSSSLRPDPVPPPPPGGGGAPSLPGGAPPALQTAPAQIPLPPSAPPPLGPPPSPAQTTGLPASRGPAGARPRSSQSPYDPNVHTPIARNVIDDYLATGKIPDNAPEFREALARAIRQSGASVPGVELTKRANATHTVMKAAASEVPEVQRRIIGEVLGKKGFLAVPATAGAGAAMSDEEQRKAMARALLNF